jgi:hypothetical protein
MAYGLTTSIHVAHFGARAVILDIRADRYRLLDGRAAALLARLGEPLDRRDRVLARKLALAGILEEGDVIPRRERPCSDVSATASIHDLEDVRGGQLAYRTAAAALILAAVSLRWRGLEATLDQRPVSPGWAADNAYDSRALEISWSYRKVRANIPIKRICLRESLALRWILLRAGCAPRIVFGVQLDPFRAHCWLEAAGVVLNDRYDTVRDFTPILIR